MLAVKSATAKLTHAHIFFSHLQRPTQMESGKLEQTINMHEANNSKLFKYIIAHSHIANAIHVQSCHSKSPCEISRRQSNIISTEYFLFFYPIYCEIVSKFIYFVYTKNSFHSHCKYINIIFGVFFPLCFVFWTFFSRSDRMLCA